MTPKNITLVDPDGDHTAIYVDGKLVDSDNGMNHTSRFIDWLHEHGVKLPFELLYECVELTEKNEGRFQP